MRPCLISGGACSDKLSLPITGGPRPVKYADTNMRCIKSSSSAKPPADQKARRHFRNKCGVCMLTPGIIQGRHMPQKMGRPPPLAGPKAVENRGVAAGQVLFAPIPARRKAATHRRSTPHGAPPDAPYPTCGRASIISKVSSRRGRMIFVSSLRGSICATPSLATAQTARVHCQTRPMLP